MLKQVIEAMELLDSASVSGKDVSALLKARGLEDIMVKTLRGEKGSTDLVRIRIPGVRGKTVKGNAPTLGVLGRLGGVGARPEMIGLVSDADGAITAVATALKLTDMRSKGDTLPGDVVIGTHISRTHPQFHTNLSHSWAHL